VLMELHGGGHTSSRRPASRQLPRVNGDNLEAVATDSYLAEIVSNPEFSLDDRTFFLRRVAWLLLERVLRDPTRESTITATMSVARALTRLLIEQPLVRSAYHRTLAGGEDLATHSVNVSMLALGLAHSLGVATKVELEHVALSALLHDIGWACNENDWRRCDPAAEAHYGARSARLLENLRLPSPVIDAVRDHHDRAGEMLATRDLSAAAAIIGFADVFEELRLVHGTRIGPHHRLEIIATVYADRFDRSLFKGFRGLLAT